MSAGDVVCTGWLIKSPPEKKLKRFAWRKRWFVLRRGRMSGNPDVLEYYQSKSSKKPIRTIDLKECEVEMLNGQLGIKREFQEKHLFVVKTSARMFYLVAKTEEEMNSWISSISHICQFGSQEEAGSSEEGFPHTPTSLRPPSDSSGRVSPSSRRPADYLVLSQCGTGSGSTCRHSSFSNSETSLEHKSTEDVLKDIVPSPPCGASSSFHCISQFGLSPKPGGLANPPLSAPCAALAPPSSSSPLRLCAVSVFQFDQPYPRASFEAADDRRTPPPLPPKPNHLSDEGVRRPRAMSARHFPKHLALLSRRTSLSSLDHFTIGNADSRSTGNRRQTLNLQSRFNTARLQSQPDESDVPMASASSCVSVIEGDGYLPMSPAVGILETRGKVEAAETLGSLARQPGGVAPPPIHRHLKPCLRRARPPPLDLRGLSTITECPAHHLFSRTKTESCFRFSGKCLAHEGSLENGDNPSNEDAYSATTESRPHFSLSVDGVVQPWARRSNLDYLSLDFNSASPSPVQKKPLLSDEHRVDYVQVDERKTQALQNTKMEWTDVRQSKT